MKPLLLCFILFSVGELYGQCTPSPIVIQVFNGPACPQNNYVLNVSPFNTGPYNFVWQRNGTIVASGSTTVAYPSPANILAQGDIVTCIRTVDSTGCADTANYIVNYRDGFTLSLSANPSGTVASGTSVTFTASQFTATLLSTFAFYVNGVSVYSVYNNGPNNSYTTSTLNNGDIVYATVQHSPVSNPCGIKDTTNNIVMSVSGVLPVSLSGFSVTASNSNFLLNWSTESESNSAYFNVQESTDGITFATIGKVIAAGNSATTKQYSYSFQPVSISGNPIYFRLQMVDKDGSMSYSSIQKASLKTNFNITISPNPATNVVYVNGVGIKQIQLLSMAGKLLYSKSTTLDNSPVDVSGLARGMYLLRVENVVGETTLQKIILH